MNFFGIDVLVGESYVGINIGWDTNGRGLFGTNVNLKMGTGLNQEVQQERMIRKHPTQRLRFYGQNAWPDSIIHILSEVKRTSASLLKLVLLVSVLSDNRNPKTIA